MKKLAFFVAAALLVAAVPALAGGGEKCSADAQSCLNHWVKGKTKGWLGLEYDKSESGAMTVKAVTPGSPAAAAGFQPGDVLLALNGIKMADKEGLKKAKGEWKIGQAVTYTVQRKDAEQQLSVTLGETPEAVFAAMIGRHMLENHVSATTAAAETKPAESKK